MEKYISQILVTALAISTMGLAPQAEARTTPARKLKVATFNIKWFGLGGEMTGDPQDESRDTSLRDFFDEYLADTQIIAFEEIVDVARLERRVLPRAWKCVSYDRANSRHQHVVLCHSPDVEFVQEPTDDNWEIEEVAYEGERGRPAVRVLVREKDGPVFARVIGVHLKAYPQETELRTQQAKALSEAIKREDAARSRSLPTIILGDFNTYPTPANNKNEDDTQILSRAFRSARLGLSHVTNPNRNTFRSGSSTGQFDHFWVSTDVSVLGTPSVWKACNNGNTDSAEGFENIQTYNAEISDHCPVKATLSIR